MKQVGILWSGGLDSTYLIWKNLIDGNAVVALSVSLTNVHEHQLLSEKNARDSIIKYITNKYSNLIPNFRHEEVGKLEFSFGSTKSQFTLSQPPIWIQFATYNSNLLDEIQLGYVMNDDAISYLDDIRNLYQAYQSFMNNPLPPLVFPLTKIKKEDLYVSLPKELRSMISYCESPILNCNTDELHPCETCLSCNRHNAMLKNLAWLEE